MFCKIKGRQTQAADQTATGPIGGNWCCAVLKRMENKGWVTSEFGEATNERGGKRKRCYTVIAEGKSLPAQNKEQRNSLWNAIPKLT